MNDLDILVASDQELMVYTVKYGYASREAARVWELRPELLKKCILKYSNNRFMFRSATWHLACKFKYPMEPVEKIWDYGVGHGSMVGMWFKIKEGA